MKTLTFDIETYRNYVLFAFRDVETKELTTFEIRGSDGKFKKKQIKQIQKLFDKYKIITYNGIKFDEPISAFSLDGYKCEKIFLAVQKLIVEKVTPYLFYRTYRINKVIKNHIDIMDPARGSASLKLYGARLGTKKLQDLPYEPETILTEAQMDEVLAYCENDNILTEELFRYLKPDLELRESMSDQYGLNLMSFKGAKIADLVIAKECGYRGSAPSKPDSITYKPPKYIKFKTPMLKELLKNITSHRFTLGDSGNVEMPDFLKEDYVFDELSYKFGLGGLHGSLSSTTIIPRDDELIVDIDYKSLYPSLIIENGFVPKHLGKKFLEVYGGMYHKRNNELKPKMKTVEYGSEEYKTLDRLQDSIKLILNSYFGQTGQRFAKVYAPDAMLHTTLSGQLTLMMVIEKLSLQGFKTFYANTDGITLLIKKKDLKKVQKTTEKFDKKTGLVMEYNYFKASHLRDVNNFVNITDDGKVKSKGTYGEPNLEKNAQTPIVFEAVRLYLQKGIDVKITISACTKIHDFCSSRRVTGGAMYSNNIPEMYPPDWQDKLNSKRGLTKKIIAEKAKIEAHWVKDNGSYLGKVVRWYYSKTGRTIHYKKSGNKVPKSDGVKPLMDLPDRFDVIKPDLDYEWYYNEAELMLADLGVLK